MPTETAHAIRAIRLEDAAAVARIDAAHTGLDKREWWREVVARYVVPEGAAPQRIGLVAADPAADDVLGYLLGRVGAFEFGSEPCGWIFAVGVRTDRLRAGVAGALLAEARRRFRDRGVRVVRTMVRRDDVPVLTFFRSQRFVAGPFVELELDLEEGAR